MMIDGEGFFILSTGAAGSRETFFTRAGDFRIDLEGNLTNNSGMFVQGWMHDARGDKIGGQIDNIVIGPAQEVMRGAATTEIEASGNLNRFRDEGVRETNIRWFDAAGYAYSARVRYEYNDTAPAGWQMLVGNQVQVEVGNTQVTYQINEAGPIAIGGTKTLRAHVPADDDFGWITITNAKLLFDNNGDIITPATVPAVPAAIADLDLVFNIDAVIRNAEAAAHTQTINIDFTHVTQQNGAMNMSHVTKNGDMMGVLSRVALNPKGELVGTYTNGETRVLATIAITTFKNPAGLQKSGSNMFVKTRNSGDEYAVEASSVGSVLMTGVLEMANVDLAMEFTEMITTQRGFQANSRVITVSDDMLQELVNLKR
jgi:flagellar hook protein FlgE